ncbi:MAG: lipid II:glycine glycyltransferase FemX [bacterium]
MKPILKIINPLSEPQWDELVLANEQASFFHSAVWARCLAETNGYKPVYFAGIENGKLETLIPMMEVRSGLTGRRGVSLPFTDYSDPVLAEGMDFGNILEQIIAHGKRSAWKVLELRDGRGDQTVFDPSYMYYGHSLDLRPGEDAIYCNFKANTKRNIKKAFKEGVTVCLSNSFESVRKFYDLNCKTCKKHGLPPQPFRFFANLHRHAIFHNHGIVALGFHKSNVVAAAIFLHFGKKAIYKYGASDPAYLSLRPNNLVMWEAIRNYARKQYQCFCFGKTDPENLGLRRFKQGWGTEEHKIFYYKHDIKSMTFVKEKSHFSGILTRIFKKAPISILRMIGTLMYRHIG